jgi:ornithine cyclodeaminase
MTAPTVISVADIRQRITMATAIDAVRDAIADLGEGAFTLPPRLSFGDGRVLMMSAYHQPSHTAVVKTLSVEFDRTPAILGTLVYTSTNGQLIVDASAVTTLRTGAIVGAATDILAPPDAAALALLGAGAQAPDQVRAIHCVRPLDTLTVFDRHPDRAETLLTNLAAELPGVTLRTADNANDAVAGADIVTCATSASTPLFPLEALPARVHVNAIGAYRPTMRELPDKLIATADLVVVDQLAAAVTEAGEIVHALNTGSITQDNLHELATLLRRRPTTTGRTVFKTVGVAAQDWAIAHRLGQQTPATPPVPCQYSSSGLSPGRSRDH